MVKNQGTKVDKPIFGVGLAAAACVAFAALLAALFYVVSGQVEQAGFRQAQYNAAQAAISGCAASYSGAVRRQCVEQVQAGFLPQETYTPRIETEVQAGLPATSEPKGLQQAVFAPH